jgi:dienelactone hydrolase
LLTAVFALTLVVMFAQLQTLSSAQLIGTGLVGTMQGSYSNSRGTYHVTVYYPALRSGANAPPDGKKHAAIVFAPGFAATKDYYTWIGNQLTPWGYVVAIFTPPNILSTDVGQWSDGISSGITYLLSTSSLKGMVDSSKIGAMGHSMGGAGAILATASDTRIKATVALAPGNIKLGSSIFAKALAAAKTVKVPVQIQVGSADNITPKDLVHQYYLNIPASGVPKEYVEIKGGGHIQFVDNLGELSKLFYGGATTQGLTVQQQHDISGQFYTAWFQYFLCGQTSFVTYIFGANAQNTLATGILSALQWVRP